MAKYPGVCLPSVCLDREVPTENVSGERIGGYGGPCMVNTTMVSAAVGESDRTPNTPVNASRLSEEPFRGQASFDGPSEAAASRLETVRRRHKEGGVSEEASKLIASGWSKGTNMAYQSAWDKWCRWCDRRQVDPV